MKKVTFFAAVLLAAPALAGFVAGPFTGSSGGAVGSPDNTIVNFNYAGPDFVLDDFIFEGDLTEVLTATYASEARIRVVAPTGTEWLVPQLTGTGGFTGTIHIGPTTYANPFGAISPIGNWTFEFYESYDDGAGADSTWNNLTVTATEYVPPPPVFLTWDMETDPGFTYDGGDWAYGQPQGLSGDPAAGYTGNNVLGYNLAGDYVNSMPRYNATSPSLDFSNYTDIQLEFQRWLGVESASWDHAGIEISTDGGATWASVWEHAGSTLNETAWSLQNYDISSWADGQSDVQIRFAMGTTDGSVTYHGWNIDDVVFRGNYIPEPASLALIALAGLFLRRR